ncbi:hypothetical protein JQ607_17885 [Bradyrhizobium liaoningense]|uniref:hypothetical protein n=1 Tax=Bradyrhizobium liaoningense TaxID=43992 RepID=UPI001BADE6F5|nr:hypothetical protein [Bradyrhizobium liaoningense]MBR0842073.1 hypothetical protein [Bradyrhizobium liaoningense]MBR0853647.1 hypothetical protein [Bradyrhizobium liaoningense]
MLIALSSSHLCAVVRSFRHKRLKGKDILRRTASPVETPASLRRSCAIRVTPWHHAFSQFGGI